MKRLFSYLTVFVLVIGSTAFAQVPRTLSYQGVLTDNNGTVVSDGDYSMTFNLYNVDVSGSPLWTETQTVAITNGVFNVILGSTNPLTISFDKPYWLGISVNGDDELAPRIELTSSAYSLMAKSVADSSISADKIQKGQVVKSINALNDDIRIVEGNNISIATQGDSIAISATATGGANTLDGAYDQGGAGAGRTITADAGAFAVDGTDGVVFSGTYDSGDIPAEGAGIRAMWYPAKAAFRLGRVNDTQWDDENIGDYSTAIGYNTTASGYGSIAIGMNTNAAAYTSTAMGNNTDAIGAYSTTMGENTTAQAYASLVLGRYNTINGTTTSWEDTEPVFVIGNGTSSQARSNAFTVLKNGNTGIGIADPNAALEVSGVDGVVFSGTYDSGGIPAEGAGIRTMWYPAKAAFRSGRVNGTQWDNDNIGNYSVAMGQNTTASGYYSTAVGYNTTASGASSVAMGSGTIASANYSFAIGNGATASETNSAAIGLNTTSSGYASIATGYAATASGYYSVAMGYDNEASGTYSRAMGQNTIASGNNSTALGSYVTTSGRGSFIIGDRSTSTVFSSATDDRFTARFAGGYYLYTNSAHSVGAYLAANASGWSTLSDSTKKENFKAVNGEEILDKISAFNLASWNYKGQDPKLYRHYGPMAQDFYAAFGNDGIGMIGNDTTISSPDFDGINFIAIQALEKRTRKIQILTDDLLSVREENRVLKQKLTSLESSLKKMEVLLVNLQEQSKKLGNNMQFTNSTK